MDANVAEVAPDIFRISIYPPGSRVSYGCFLVRDDNPAMVETGLRSLYDLVHSAVCRLIDPAKLRYLIIPHFEMDECGSLNRFLAIAPNAEPVCSPVGGIVTLRDFSERPPKVVGNGEKLLLGQKELRFVLAPWVHYWDSLLVYDETDRALFTSDLFMQPGDREASIVPHPGVGPQSAKRGTGQKRLEPSEGGPIRAFIVPSLQGGHI